VNETFVKQYVQGRGPLGSHVIMGSGKQGSEIVGVVKDAPYRYMREPMKSVVFVPFRELDEKGGVEKESNETFVIRTEGDDPMALAMELRKEVAQAGMGLRVSNAETQQELMDRQTVRERLLAALGGFFAGVALLLAAIGLYGVLHYSVVLREREIGIRIALGTAAGNIARIVTVRVMAMVLFGVAAGLALGAGSERYVASLLYGVKGTELSMMALPAAVLLGAAVLAALPAVMRAVRIDPVRMLRAE
jgi:ABC-type antimicrobial peptide transport system permease subunit